MCSACCVGSFPLLVLFSMCFVNGRLARHQNKIKNELKNTETLSKMGKPQKLNHHILQATIFTTELFIPALSLYRSCSSFYSTCSSACLAPPTTRIITNKNLFVFSLTYFKRRGTKYVNKLVKSPTLLQNWKQLVPSMCP